MNEKEIEDNLLRLLREASGGAGSTAGGLPGPGQNVAQLLGSAVADVLQPVAGPAGQTAGQLEQLRLTAQAETKSRTENTQALAQNTSTQRGTEILSELPVLSNLPLLSQLTGGGSGSAIGKALGGFTLSPIISGLLSLFGGGGDEAPPPLVPFALPPAVRLDAGITQASRGDVFNVDRGSDGAPRIVDRPSAVNAPQVTIQVQAMDSRSFLDNSDQIAQAVREALLNSHALGDVVADL